MSGVFGLLKTDSDFTMSNAAKRPSARFPTYSIEHKADIMVVSTAGHIGGPDLARDIAACERHVELGNDTPDPEMEHFSDYLNTNQVLQSFQGLIAVDPRERSLL